jgi:ABC-type sugar transport system ATPase subunit
MNSETLLKMKGISKGFPGVQALSDVSFEVNSGEVHCLLGENGAGKSTLMKILSGSQQADTGTMEISGAAFEPKSPLHAQTLGVSIIHQELNLCAEMSIAENVMLGREPTRGPFGLLDHATQRHRTEELLNSIHVELDVRRPVGSYSIAQQQMVEIAKALSFDSRILVMDEPTTALTDHEIRGLFALIERLKTSGVGIVYISHRLDEVQEIGDRATILRDGCHVLTEPIQKLDRDSMIHAMVGRSLEEEYPQRVSAIGSARLEVEGLSREGAFQGISFQVHAGELVGLTGLVGAGRTELARALFGAEPTDSGTIRLDGEAVDINSPQAAKELGLGLLPEDRKRQGFIGALSIRENIALPNFGILARWGIVWRKLEADLSEKFVSKLGVRTPSSEQLVVHLSGGNQQKVVLAKWLATQCTLLIFDEPTQGVDVGAKTEIYGLMNELLENGVAILMISSDFPEILGMSDRILVMREGHLSGELSRDESDQEAILSLA